MPENSFKYENLEEEFYEKETVIAKYNHRIGVLNKLGDIIIDFKYASLNRFENGFICQNYNNSKYILFDRIGKKLCDNEFDDIGLFYNGIAKIKKGYGWGFIDTTGKEICEAKYSQVFDFHDSLALVADSHSSSFKFIDISGKVISESEYCRGDNHISSMVSPGLYEIECELIGVPIFLIYINFQGVLFKTIFSLSEGRRLVREESSFNRPSPYKWGYLNSKGRIVIPCEHAIGTTFLNGKALVSKLYKNGQKQNFFIDKRGKKIREIENYDFISQYKQGLSWVNKDNLWGFINADGDEKCHPKYVEHKDFFNGIAIVRNNDYYYGFINSDGNEISDFKYVNIQNFKNGVAIANIQDTFNNCCFVLISESGQELTSQGYFSIEEFERGFAKVKNFRGKYGFINRKGVEKIPCKFNYTIEINKKGTFEVCVKDSEDKWVELDLKGNFIRIFHPESYYEEKPYTYRDSIRDAYGDTFPDDSF